LRQPQIVAAGRRVRGAGASETIIKISGLHKSPTWCIPCTDLSIPTDGGQTALLRIVETHAPDLVTLSLEGRLLAPWVDETRGLVAARLGDKPVRLNITRLSFADVEGMALLREWHRQGIAMFSSSLYSNGLLELIERESR
jgi:hypothetical protein